jgi:hypothetical protein
LNEQGPSRRRTWIALEIGPFVAGIVGMIAGDRLQSEALLDGGLALFGAAFLGASMDAFATHRVGFAASAGATSGYRTYRRGAAICWGIVLGEVGMGIIGLAAIRLLDVQRAAVGLFLERPGVLILGLGVLLVALGGVPLLDPREREGPRAAALLALPLRLLGVLPLLLGLAVFGVGLVEVAAPEVFDAWFAPVQAFLGPLSVPGR